MGIAALVKRVFAPRPLRIDYTSFPDERLVALWAERSQLTNEARALLETEAARRNLSLASVADASHKEPSLWPAFEEAQAARDDELRARRDLEAMEPGAIVVLQPCCVALRTQGKSAVLVVLPLREASMDWTDGFDLGPDLTIEALVVCNQSRAGHLPVAWLKKRLGLSDHAVFWLDAPPGETQMPRRLDRGFLRLKRSKNQQDALFASWTGESADRAERLLVGPAVRFEEVASFRANVVVGGLAVPDPKLATLLDSVMALRRAILMLDVEGVRPWAEVLARLGVNTMTVGTPANADPTSTAPGRVALAIKEGDWEKVAAELRSATPADIETITTGLLIQPHREGDAARVAELACGIAPDAGARWFERGAISYLRGSHDEAIGFYTRATEAAQPDPRAWANLAAIYLRRGDAERALHLAERAHTVLPTDAISLAHRLGALLALGRSGEARSVLAEHGSAFDDVQRRVWDARISEGRPPPMTRDSFPHLARPAYECGSAARALSRLDDAVAFFRRAVELQPSHIEARLELGTALSELGRDREAVEVYSQGIETAALAGEAAALRFNRARCRIRLGELSAARDDLKACVELLPEWPDAKTQLATVEAQLRR